MMKQIRMIMVLTIVLTMFLTFPAYAYDSITVTVNDEYLEFEEPPLIQNNRTLVPLRVIFEAIGLEVEWEQETRSIIALKDDVTIKLKINDLNFSIGNPEVGVIEAQYDVAPQIINDTTYVPVRLIGDLTGCVVFWEPETKNVRIIFNGREEFTNGESTYVDEDLRYEHIGYYNNASARYFGIGKRTYANGEVYVGNFYDNYAYGYGTLYQDEIIYRGNWDKDKLNGPGSITYPEGDRFVGSFKDGSMYGYGEFYFNDGEKYLGNFAGGFFWGYGVYYFKDGARYEGEFIPLEGCMGVFEGEGTFYYPDGRIESGIWKEGKLIKKY